MRMAVCGRAIYSPPDAPPVGVAVGVAAGSGVAVGIGVGVPIVCAILDFNEDRDIFGALDSDEPDAPPEGPPAA